MILKKIILIILCVTVGLWLACRPQTSDPSTWPDHATNLLNGEQMFHAGGCASCHGEDLSGGQELPFRLAGFAGVFRVPNISPDRETGIGRWDEIDFVNAMKHGVSPDGRHYYPSFPYGSYARMAISDLLDLKAYMDTLPAVQHRVAGHELSFPLTIRPAIGLWKRLHLEHDSVVDGEGRGEVWLRGQYLVEAVGHCGECHTPRDATGGLRPDAWLAGAPNPEGRGRIPNITPHGDGLGDWSRDDVEFYLESGFTPDYDAVGGSMVDVQENLARLPAEDRAAIAAYLAEIPALPASSD